MRQMALSPAELREDLQRETARAQRLEQRLRLLEAENGALRAARDVALRLAAWGGLRSVKGTTRHEH